MSDKDVVSLEEDGRVFFHCPGCDISHMVYVTPGNRPVWGFNGDKVKPTLTPSILVSMEWGGDRANKICHSFVTDGRIQFLNDCTHQLAGQTVDLPVWED